MKTNIVSIKKSDAVKQIVYGEVYIPMIPDSDGDIMTAENIELTSHKFMKALRNKQIDVNHDLSKVDATVVETFIARPGDKEFIEGSWVVGVHIEDPDVWASVEKGELNGFSMYGTGYSTQSEVEMEIPEFVEGRTHLAEEHDHKFIVKFDDEGNFLGGWTDEAEDGHKHSIIRGTATEDGAGHSHRFAFVEVLHGA